MTYGLVLRKLVINGINYYQAIDKVIGEKDLDDVIHVIEGDKYLNQDLYPFEANNNIVYLEINEATYKNLNNDKTIFFKEIDGELRDIPNVFEQNNVTLEFFEKFHDFSLVPDYDSLELVNDLRKKLKEKILGQDRAIFKITNKIYNNLMFSESNLDSIDIAKNKSNILVIGPFGTGKTTIKKLIKNSLKPIPIIEYKLTGDYEKDIYEITKKLLLASDGNIYLAGRGIVIFDGINSFSSNYLDTDNGTVNFYMDTLLKILKTGFINYQDTNNNFMTFDYSFVTNICMIDIDYDYEEKNTDLYTRIDFSKILELGITDELIFNCFDNEIIYMEEMTHELALEILKDKNISPLYQIKKTLEKKGKIVKISRDFVSSLISYGLGFNEGFEGIIRGLKYVLQNKDMNSKTITFKKEEFEFLEIGTIFSDDDFKVESSENKQTEKYKPIINNDLEINLEKRTINDLTVLDTVELIKENIKGQDEQIFMVVNAFYNHQINKIKNLSKHELKELKNNVLLIGKTGVGKTAIIENLARIFNIVYRRESAPRYTKSGYVGENVDSMLLNLVDAAHGDIEKAQNAILYIDEVDKIRATHDKVDMGLGVQEELLTLIEGDVRTIYPTSLTPTPMYRPLQFDTSGLHIIASGAFHGLDEITKKRVKKEKAGNSIGFKKEDQEKVIIENTTVEDLEEYGMDSQFIARLPVIINLNILGEDILYKIVNDSKDGYVNLCKKSYALEGISLEISDGFKRNLAKKAFLDKKGARSIKTIFSKITSEIDKNIVTGDIEKVILSDNSLDDFKSIQYVKRKK